MRTKLSGVVALSFALLVGGLSPAHSDEVAPGLITDLVVLYENGNLDTTELSAPLSLTQAEAASAKLTKTSAVKIAAPDVEITLIDSVQTIVGADPNLWGLDRSDQGVPTLDGAYNYSATGDGVTIYVVDTGLNTTHNEFTGRIGTGRNFYADPADPNYTSAMTSDQFGSNSNVTDCNGHGTHVSGTAAGTTYGIAKEATIVPIRVFGCGNTGSLSYLLNGLEWLELAHVGTTPAVVNMSLGNESSELVDIFMNMYVSPLIEENLTVVAASGNENADACGSTPAKIPAVLTVNALMTSVDPDTQAVVDGVPGFSNYGECTDIYAPGYDISSAWYTSDTATALLDGTSMASPHVAGIAARILQYNPTFTPAQVTNLILGTATYEELWADQDLYGDTHLVLNYDDLTPIAVPRNVSVSTVAGNGDAVVTWGAPTDDRIATVTGYEVTASNNGGSCQTTTQLTCTLTDLTPGSSYTVQVKAKTNGTPVSSATSATFTPYVLPTAPRSIVATAGNASAVVSWDAPASTGTGSLSGYTVRAVGGNQTCETTDALQCTVSGLTNGTAYQFEVIAHTTYGDSIASSSSMAVTPFLSTSAPQATVATAGNASAVVDWRAPATLGTGPISGYTVSTVGGDQTCETSGALRCTVTGLTNGTAYQFTVVAHTPYGDTAASASTAAVTPRTVTSAPRSVAVSITTAGKAKVSWSAPTSLGGAAITKYQYCLSSCSSSTSWKSAGLSRFVVVATKKGVTRTIYIRAVNAAGNSTTVKKVYKQTK